MVRRDFLKASAIGAAGIMMPAGIVSASAAPKAPAKKSANGMINMGFIGLGQQAMYLLSGFMSMSDVRVVAGCDVYDIKRDRFVKRVTDYYQGKGEKKVKVDVYEDYQDVLARPDIDAVVIAAPDHQHAIIAIAACKAGKDVYLEKPMTLTIYEGQQLVKAVRKYNRILQVGSQQRSSDEFILAATHAREGDLGQIKKIKVYVGRNDVNPYSAAPVPCNLPKMEVPAGLNWDKWLGPLPTSVYYHSNLDPIVDNEHNEQLWGAWRWYKPMGGGLMTDWGAHMFDIAQWAIGKDGSGPVEIIPAGYSYFDHLTYKYDNGIIVTEEPFDGSTPGVQIYGEDGWIKVSRGKYEASDKKLEMKGAAGDDSVPYETKVGHHRAFIEAVKSRIDPNVPVEVGHSSCTVCNLGNIAMDLGRPVVWNPIVQKFMHDPEATKLMHYDYRPGYKLDV
ncbi:MAG: Gfo/Idh/MocA family oxidoreductase [Bacteroidales bacterium]|jgi:predicted dehydrogenase|nr:Gfo/Idh/MocA family oxidoreductase [Bacteroidales bacterium]MCR5463929.1 Gfo/Idh/MocA family oxidoreductase [Bacteroidales bacterium]